MISLFLQGIPLPKPAQPEKSSISKTVNHTIVVNQFTDLYNSIQELKIKSSQIVASIFGISCFAQYAKIDEKMVEKIIETVAQQQKFICKIYVTIQSECLTISPIDLIGKYQWKFLTHVDFFSRSLSPSKTTLNHFNFDYLGRLDLSFSSIDHNGVRVLAKTKYEYLEHVNLSRNPIGSRGIKYIAKAKWPRLKVLLLTNVSAEACSLKYLRKMDSQLDECIVSVKQLRRSWYQPVEQLYFRGIRVYCEQKIDQTKLLPFQAIFSKIEMTPDTLNVCLEIIKSTDYSEHKGCGDSSDTTEQQSFFEDMHPIYMHPDDSYN